MSEGRSFSVPYTEELRHEVHESHHPERLPNDFYLRHWYEFRKNHISKRMAERHPGLTPMLLDTMHYLIDADSALNETELPPLPPLSDRTQEVDNEVRAAEANVADIRYREISNWYRSLGTFNKLFGAAPSLAHGGAIVTSRRVDRHLQGERKLLGPSLYFEAGLVADPLHRQGHYQESLYWFDRYIHWGPETIISGNKNTAVRLRGDLLFRMLFEEATERASGEAWSELDRYRFRRLQQEYIKDFLSYIEAGEEHIEMFSGIRNPEKRLEKINLVAGTIAGTVYEWAVPLAHRHVQILNGTEHTSTIRNSTPREQHPLLQTDSTDRSVIGPRHSIDTVVNLFKHGVEVGEIREQLKKSGVSSSGYIRGVAFRCAEFIIEPRDNETVQEAELRNSLEFIDIFKRAGEAMLSYYANPMFVIEEEQSAVQAAIKLSQVDTARAAA